MTRLSRLGFAAGFAVFATLGVLGACVGSDPDAAPVIVINSEAGAGSDGSSPGQSDGGPSGPSDDAGPCGDGGAFADDLENAGSGPEIRCWSRTSVSPYPFTHGVEPIGLGTESSNAYRVQIDGGGGSGATAVHITRSAVVPAPAVIRFRVRVDALVNENDARSGFFALTIHYLEQNGAFSQPAKVELAIGSPATKRWSPYFLGGAAQSLDLEAGWHDLEIRLAKTTGLRINGMVPDNRTLELPNTPISVQRIDIGLVRAGTVSGPLDIAYDNISIQPAP